MRCADQELFVQQRPEEREKFVGDELRAFGGGMNAVVLNGVGDGVDVKIDVGDNGHVVLRRHEGEGLVELADIVGPIVRRQGDAGEDDLAAGLEQSGDDGGEVAPRVGDGNAAEAVVAAEFDDYDSGAQGEDVFQAVDAVFGGIAADSGVDDAVMVAAIVEVGLQVVRVAATGIDAVAGGNAVSETDDDGKMARAAGNGAGRRCVQNSGQRNQGGSGREAAIHSFSLAMRASGESG